MAVKTSLIIYVLADDWKPTNIRVPSNDGESQNNIFTNATLVFNTVLYLASVCGFARRAKFGLSTIFPC